MILLATRTCGHPLFGGPLLCVRPPHADTTHVYQASDAPDRHTDEGSDDQ